MVLGLANFGTFWTLYWALLMMNPVMGCHTGDLFATQITYFQLAVGLRFGDFVFFVPMLLLQRGGFKMNVTLPTNIEPNILMTRLNMLLEVLMRSKCAWT